MSAKFQSIALTGNHTDQRVIDALQSIAAHLVERGFKTFAADSLPADCLPSAARQLDEQQLAAEADLVIAVGGDGSMLRAARLAVRAGKPVLGINRGRLGFLADVSPNEDFETLDRITDGEYESEHRMLLTAEVQSDNGTRDCGIAMNDVVIKRPDNGRMLEFRSYVDERYVNTHGGDGFIVATPTGSTAYALSCGGPIVTPGLDALVLAPICPHTLSDRPVVIPGSSISHIDLGETQNDSATVSCDGEVTGQLGTGERLRIAAADQRVELIHPVGYDYYGILRSKLHWGRGNRNPSR